MNVIVDGLRWFGPAPALLCAIASLLLLATPVVAEEVAAAPRALLLKEDSSNPTGTRLAGSATWRTEAVDADGRAQDVDVAVRADVEIPACGLKATVLIRHNTDPSLPASHTAELTFELPRNAEVGSIQKVPGILLKPTEQARGTALTAVSVKVADGIFLIGLSNLDAERVRNVQLLRERDWFDIPIVYANQHRAILVIEKGASGRQAFDEAFTAWGQASHSNPRETRKP
jgi:hypothetical protein